MQRRVEAHDSLDDFPTPPWATRALCELLIFNGFDLANSTVWEPACNRGYMARPLSEYFGEVWASDIHDYGYSEFWKVNDFLMPFSHPTIKTNWIITNPPFRLAEQFIERAGQVAQHGFAMIVRSAFLEGKGRYENLFSKNPPTIIAQFAERVPMVKGRYDPKASTATSYAWLVWIKGCEGTKFVWIPPCRKKLERDGDA